MGFWRSVLVVVVVMVVDMTLGAGGAGAAGCPNEAVRGEQGVTRLPDCRAYEQVTPAYKQGYVVFPRSISADGDKAILFSLANLAGTEGAGESPFEGEVYTASRQADGWRLSPLNAPLSEFVGQFPVAFEAQSGATLWKQHTPSQSAPTRGLYARSAEGHYRFLGQIGVPFEGEETQEADYMYLTANHEVLPVAATHDYEHVIAESAALAHLPFDTETVGRSLYEYSGTDNPPVLVGVEGSEKGGRRLVSRCGATLGSETLGSVYNAISADGETVFFTAKPFGECGVSPAPATAEVYARLHGSALSPLPAETVHVSASECTEACGTTESSKNFEGASEDGKIVYFTSTQKLTNDATDGTASGEAYKGSECQGTTPGEGGCNLYVYDFEAPGVECRQEHHCLRLVAGGEVMGVAGIAEDGRRVYYVKRDPAGMPDLYVYDLAEERSTLVAHLSFTGEESSIWRRQFKHPVEVTGEDGRYLLFASATPHLTPDDESAVVQLFEYDAVTGELVRVTKGEDGYNDNGNGVAFSIPLGAFAEQAGRLSSFFDFKSETNQLSISQDGETVVFETRGGLSPLATSAEQCASVYEFHTAGSLSSGEVHLLSDGQDTHSSVGHGCGAFLYLATMDRDGENVLFSTADALVPTDTDGGQRDLYDARVGGGFALPGGGGLCAGEGCGLVGSSGGVPGFVAGGSAVRAPEAPVVSSARSSSGGGASPGVKPKARGVSRFVLLARALRACRSGSRARRSVCERSARRRYGPVKGRGARVGRTNAGRVR